MLTVEQILEHYRKEFPFTEGEESPNRDRYYWLSGLLRDVEAKTRVHYCNASNPKEIQLNDVDFGNTTTLVWS